MEIGPLGSYPVGCGVGRGRNQKEVHMKPEFLLLPVNQPGFLAPICFLFLVDERGTHGSRAKQIQGR